MKKDNGFDYSKEDIIKALIEAGIKNGDNIFIHSNIGFFGRLKNAQKPEDYYIIFKEAIFSVIGSEGTLIVPTFSYSFCWNQNFEQAVTPSVCGFFSEMVRKDYEALRSNDANFSVAVIGKNAEYFTKNSPNHSFGENSFWSRFLESDGKICNFNFDSASTFIHYVEKVLNVPYRYDKEFTGIIVEGENQEKKSFYHFVYDHENPDHTPNFVNFDKIAKLRGFARTANLGKGQIVVISARDTFSLIEAELKKNPNFLIHGNK